MTWTLTILFFAFSSCEFVLAGDKQSEPDFSGYPQVLGFLSCVNMHTNAARNLQQTNFLVVTEFYRMDRLGGDMLRYIVTEGGQTLDYLDNGDNVVNDPHRRQLSKEALNRLRAAVDKLPTTNQYPWLASMVIVSHRDGTNWITHSYGRHRAADEPPESPALRELLNIIGERREANEWRPF